MDLTRSGQFQIITDPAYPKVDLVISHLTYLLNLPTFGSTFWINLLNQLTRSAFSLIWRRHWFVVRHFLQTYVCRIVLLPTKVHMIQVVDFLADHRLVEAWSVSPSSTPWWRCGWKPCWTQLGLLPCADVSFVFRKVRVADENDKGLLSSKPVAPKPDEYVGLDLTWSDVRTSAGARHESWAVSEWYECIRMMQVTRPVGRWEIEAGVELEVEVDVKGWGMQWPEGLIAPDRELELDK